MSFARVQAGYETPQVIAPLDGYRHFLEPLQYRLLYGNISLIGEHALTWIGDTNGLPVCAVCARATCMAAFAQYDTRTGVRAHNAIAMCSRCVHLVEDQTITDKTHTWVMTRIGHVSVLRNDDDYYMRKLINAMHEMVDSHECVFAVKSSLGGDIFAHADVSTDHDKKVLQRCDASERPTTYTLTDSMQLSRVSARDMNVIASSSYYMASSPIRIIDLRMLTDDYVWRMERSAPHNVIKTAFASEHLLAVSAKHAIMYYDIRGGDAPVVKFDLGDHVCTQLV